MFILIKLIILPEVRKIGTTRPENYILLYFVIFLFNNAIRKF